MQTWEYRSVENPEETDVASLGNQGWELVTIYTSEIMIPAEGAPAAGAADAAYRAAPTVRVWVFKRPTQA